MFVESNNLAEHGTATVRMTEGEIETLVSLLEGKSLPQWQVKWLQAILGGWEHTHHVSTHRFRVQHTLHTLKWALYER